MQRESDRLIEKLDNVISARCGIASGAMASSAPASAKSNKTNEIQGVSAAPASEPGADITNKLTGAAYERWVSSLREYRNRYKGIGDRDLSVQMNCLERTLKLCDERGIKVVLVNLPLTKANRDLMPEHFYERFGRQLAAVAGKHKADVTYFDLSMDSRFKDIDFWDTVHMNQLGGAKLLEAVVPTLKSKLAVSAPSEPAAPSVRSEH